MAYSGPTYQSREQDRRGDYIMQGAESFGKSMAAGIGKFSDRLKEIADNRTTAAALDSGLSAMRQTRPDLAPVIDGVADEFAGANLKGKQTIFSQLMAAGMRLDQQTQTGVENQYKQQQIGLQRRGVELQEGKFLHDTDPTANLPVPYELPSGTTGAGGNVLVNPNTGNLIDVPDTSGSDITPLPGTNYGIPTYNGRAMGVIPMNQGRQNAAGFRLEPIQGTGMALPVGPDGKPIDGMGPYQMKKATDFRGALQNLFGKGEYEPATPTGANKAPTVREFVDPKTQERRTMQWDSSIQQWVPAVGGDSIFPTTPENQPGALNKSNPATDWLEAARSRALSGGD